MRWISANDRMPVIDNKKPSHYLFVNRLNHHAINIWTEFIKDWPTLIRAHKIDWEWLDEAHNDLDNLLQFRDKYGGPIRIISWKDNLIKFDVINAYLKKGFDVETDDEGLIAVLKSELKNDL